MLWLESDRSWVFTAHPEPVQIGRTACRSQKRAPPAGRQPGVRHGVRSGGYNTYPADNPYSWPVIGYMRDLDAASLDDVTDFFKTYYAPTNATLVLAGDFVLARAKELIAKYFGPLKRGPAIHRPSAAPVRLAAEQRPLLEDSRATVPQFQIVWPAVPNGHADGAPLNALAHLLSADRTSRLTKVLVYDRQLATSAGVGSGQNENSGSIGVYISPRPGASLTEIERLTDSILTSARTTPFTEAELERYKVGARVNAVTRLDRAIAKADVLAEGQVYFGDPLNYVKQQKAALAVTLKDVQRVARQHLDPGPDRREHGAGRSGRVSRPDLPAKNVTPTPEK